MTTEIQKEFTYNAGVYFNNTLVINNFVINLHMDVETDNVREQNVAMERLGYFIDEVLDSTFFVERTQTEVIEKYINAGLKVALLPEEPYDQIFGMILLLKLNAIMEKRLIINDLTIFSKLSDGVKFNVSLEMAEAIFSGNHWWNNMSCNVVHQEEKSKKIVQLFSDEWTKIGLSWKDKGKSEGK